MYVLVSFNIIRVIYFAFAPVERLKIELDRKKIHTHVYVCNLSGSGHDEIYTEQSQ